jgi:hypothetical protein
METNNIFHIHNFTRTALPCPSDAAEKAVPPGGDGGSRTTRVMNHPFV